MKLRHHYATVFWAFLFSVLLHFALIFEVEIPIQGVFAPPPLQVEITRPVPVVVAAQATAKKSAKPAKRTDKKIVKASPEVLAPPIAPPPVIETLQDIPSLPESTASEELTPDSLAKTSLAENDNFVYPDRKIEIHYTLYSGGDFAVGRVSQTYLVKNRSYTITSIGEASGLVSLFMPGKYVQVSQGKVTPQGLKPDSFWIERGQAVNKRDSALFDWPQQILRYVTHRENPEVVTLPSNTQDLLSFLYQFSFSPPNENQEINITNGRKLNRYTYEFKGEELLETPLGTLNTVHLARRKEGLEGAEVWLAKDFEFFPVKIQLSDKKGDTLTQIANTISINVL